VYFRENEAVLNPLIADDKWDSSLKLQLRMLMLCDCSVAEYIAAAYGI